MTHRPKTAELWHWTWGERTGGAPLAWGQAWSDDLVVVGGDFHRPEEGHPPGIPTTWVLGDPLCSGADAVVEVLAQGRTAVSAAPDGPLLLRHGDEFLALDADGLILWGADTRTVVRGDRALLPARPGVHRLETPANEVMALCT